MGPRHAPFRLLLLLVLCLLPLGAWLAYWRAFAVEPSDPFQDGRLVAILLGAGVLAAMAVVLAWHAPYRSLRRSLNEVSEGARRIRKGETTAPIDVMRLPGDLQELGEGINALAESVAKADAATRQFESQLEATQARQRAMVNAVPDGVLLLDGEGRILAANEAAEKLLGRSSADAVGRAWTQILFSEKHRAQGETDPGAMGGGPGRVTERTITRPDGTEFEAEFTLSPVTLDGDRGRFICVLRDATAQRHAARAIRDQFHTEAAQTKRAQSRALMENDIRPAVAHALTTGGAPPAASGRHTSYLLQRVKNAVETLADFQDLDAGPLPQRQDTFEIARLVESLVGGAAPEAFRRGLELAFEIDPAVPRLAVGDADRLARLLDSLIHRSLQRTERGEIVVSVAAQRLEGDRHELRFWVRDTGPGLPVAEARGAGATAQADVVLLALWKRVAEQWNGRLGVETAPGRGTTVLLAFPVEEVPAAVTPRGRAREASLQKRRVLVLDDNAAARRILQVQAERWGMAVRAVESPTEALRVLESPEALDVAVIDQTLDGHDVRAFIRSLRRIEARRSLPLVLLTAPGVPDAPEGLHDGVDKTIPKPAPEQALREAIAGLLDRSVLVDAPPPHGIPEPAPAPAPPRKRKPSSVTKAGARVTIVPDAPPAQTPSPRTRTRPASTTPKPTPVAAPPVAPARPPPSPTAPPRRHTGPLDEATLAALRSGANGDRVDEALAAFLKESPVLMAEARGALASGDVHALERAAHALGKLAVRTGALQLGMLCENLEQAASNVDVPSASRVYRDIEIHHRTVKLAAEIERRRIVT